MSPLIAKPGRARLGESGTLNEARSEPLTPLTRQHRPAATTAPSSRPRSATASPCEFEYPPPKFRIPFTSILPCEISCFVPLVPLGTKHLYHCTTCRTSSPYRRPLPPQTGLETLTSKNPTLPAEWNASASGPAPPLAPQAGGFYGPGQGQPGGGYGGGGYNPGYGQQRPMGYREFGWRFTERSGRGDGIWGDEADPLDSPATQPAQPGYH